MKNAHKEELEKTQRSQISGLNSDVDELRLQYEYVFYKGKPKLCIQCIYYISWVSAFNLDWGLKTVLMSCSCFWEKTVLLYDERSFWAVKNTNAC